VLWVDVVAYEGGEFEIVVPSPVADFVHFGGGEEAEICVAADEVGLFADGEAVVADWEALFQFSWPYVWDGSLLAMFIEIG